jgi:hypothetical protein
MALFLGLSDEMFHRKIIVIEMGIDFFKWLFQTNMNTYKEWF